MTDQELIDLLRTRPAEINRLVNRVLPIKVGALAKAHFRENFRLSGFMNGGLRSWPATRRQQTGGKGAAANYGPLLSRRNRLYGSIGYKPGPGYVVIGTTLPYASIHNDGGTVSPTVTLKMRKFAWAMYYKALGAKTGGKAAKHGGHGNAAGKTGGKKGKKAVAISPEAERWKALALTRKEKLTIVIPKRQFIGDSQELNSAINQKIAAELEQLFEKR
jgi:phage gpG-like protein